MKANVVTLEEGALRFIITVVLVLIILVFEL